MTATRTLTMATLSTGYPREYRPIETRDSEFWTGSNDDRTFFALFPEREHDMPFLVAATTDPRAAGWRPAAGREADDLTAAGFDLDTHWVWSVDEMHLSIEEPVEPATHALRLVRVHRDYPNVQKPNMTRTSDFWTGPEEGRTFFAMVPADEDGTPFLVAPNDDERSMGWRTHTGQIESAALQRVGIDPTTHRVWSIMRDYITEVEDSTPEPEPGDWFTWGSRVQWFRFKERQEAGVIASDAYVMVADGDAAVLVERDHAWSPEETEGGAAFFKPDSEDLHPVVKRVIGAERCKVGATSHGGAQVHFPPVGEEIDDNALRVMRGILFTRQGNRGSLWITHGDGTATQIEGDSGVRRMGVGTPHAVYTPTNNWVSRGWRFHSSDLSRVPADPPVVEESDVKEVEASATLRTEVEALERALNEERERHQRDIEVIGARLISEAEYRSWCAEYDSIVDSLNSELTVELPRRTKEFEVVMDVTVRVIRRVKANNDEDAYERVSEAVSTPDLNMDNLRSVSRVSVRADV